MFQPCRIAVALHRDGRDGALDFTEIVGSQFDGSRADVLFQALQLRCTRDRDDPGLLSQQPGDRDLSGRRLLPGRDFAEQIDQGLVRPSRLRREARMRLRSELDQDFEHFALVHRAVAAEAFRLRVENQSSTSCRSASERRLQVRGLFAVVVSPGGRVRCGCRGRCGGSPGVRARRRFAWCFGGWFQGSLRCTDRGQFRVVFRPARVHSARLATRR